MFGNGAQFKGKEKPSETLNFKGFQWRRVWDSNPRAREDHRISSAETNGYLSMFMTLGTTGGTTFVSNNLANQAIRIVAAVDRIVGVHDVGGIQYHAFINVGIDIGGHLNC